jgi:hypothetical protein
VKERKKNVDVYFKEEKKSVITMSMVNSQNLLTPNGHYTYPSQPQSFTLIE